MKVAVTTTALTTKTDDKCGIIFYFHGGGMCVGTAQDGMNLYFEGRNGYIVVCPSYRMAPEFKFPYSPNDCFDCVKYFINNNNNNNDSIKKKYNIDISKICLVGTSAGGGLSAAVAIECKRNNIPITCTSLLIPMLAPPCTESYQTNSRLSTLLSCDTMLWFWRMYASPKDYTNPLCAPLFASDETLKDFPTTFLYTGTMDVLRDECVLFGERLRKLGIKVKQIQAVGTHVGCLLSNPSILQKFIDSIFEVVEESPSFPGGVAKLYEFLSKQLRYPEMAKENGIQGKVFVQFVVCKDGSIKDVKVIKSIHNILDKEASRVVKRMPKWSPGKQRGKAVNTKFTLPIKFKIS